MSEDLISLKLLCFSLNLNAVVFIALKIATPTAGTMMIAATISIVAFTLIMVEIIDWNIYTSLCSLKHIAEDVKRGKNKHGL